MNQGGERETSNDVGGQPYEGAESANIGSGKGINVGKAAEFMIKRSGTPPAVVPQLLENFCVTLDCLGPWFTTLVANSILHKLAL